MEHLTECDCDRCLLLHMRAPGHAERQQAWAAWYRRDAPALFSFIDRRCGKFKCREHSEDILQDCFLIAFRNVSNGTYMDQDKGLNAYLAGIAKNRLRELHRLQLRETVSVDEIDVECVPGLDADSSLYLNEVVNMVRDVYRRRPHVHQRVVAGIYREGKSSSQLAAELGMNAGNVRTIAHRAVREIGHNLKHQHSMDLSSEAIRACLEVL
jgi:RNA polymerase sigma factor (sigma-70 family)